MINRDRTCYDCSFVQFWRASGHGGYGYSCDKYTGEITKKKILDTLIMGRWKFGITQKIAIILSQRNKNEYNLYRKNDCWSVTVKEAFEKVKTILKLDEVKLIATPDIY